MNIIHNTVVKLEEFKKCELVCVSECPLGELHDFCCKIKSIIVAKIQEEDQKSRIPEG